MSKAMDSLQGVNHEPTRTKGVGLTRCPLKYFVLTSGYGVGECLNASQGQHSLNGDYIGSLIKGLPGCM